MAGLTRVGVYERTLPVSGLRVWENVRDWEHLPWLHASSFSSIDLVDEGDWGWRARIGTSPGQHILLELVIEKNEPRYVSRTLEGGAAGSEIWTQVDARGESETHVSVEFWLPQVTEAKAASLGDGFVKLYRRLWDEDESMMLRRAQELEARKSGAKPAAESAAVRLGTLDEVRSRLPLLARFAGETFRVVELDGTLVAHATLCPHRFGPLEEAPIEDGRVVCPWHGYSFDVTTGNECTGRRMKLARAPRVRVDAASGQVTLEGPV